MARDTMLQIQFATFVNGVPVDGDHASAHQRAALCRSDTHAGVSAERTLREGNRVLVAVTRDDRDDEYQIAELRCAYCPLSVDVNATVMKCRDVYDAGEVIVAEATLRPHDTHGLVLGDAEIIAAETTLPSM